MKNNQVTIRGMTEKDIPSLLEVEAGSFPTPWTERMFRCQIKLEEISVNLVAEAKGRTIGYAASWIGYEELHLLSIAVLPEMRGSGVAGLLLERIIERAKAAGALKIILEVRAGNARAQGFYLKHGFAQIGLRKKYYAENGEDALVMELDLERLE